ncbi:MAG TPA: PilT/PilU family type 4a pilus ATPase, partial [Blastocatellia bacterium]|nr:PilT/PilU family type 4a pilus ATPase [Blastocatellia bacterium]
MTSSLPPQPQSATLPSTQNTNANPAMTAATESFNRILVMMTSVSEKVSDLIFSPGRPPQVELNSRLTAVEIPGLEMIKPEHTATMASVMTHSNPIAAQMLAEHGSADLSYSVPGHGRFRVNIFKQRGSHAIVMRVIAMRIPSFDELRLPLHLKQIADLKNGIVLVTGPTGSGKSSTLAAIIDHINETRFDHILTIEDPVEFIHRHKNCTVHQRELHSDTPSFSLALRAALRQAPKVILVGEMRDRETIEIAMEAAETGHLVFSTLHTIDASKTVDRIIGVFPKNEEQSIRMRLSQTFRYIISQRLLPRSDVQGRIAAIEILKSTARTKEYLEKGERDGKSLIDAMRDGELEGMQCFDQVLEHFVRQGLVTLQTAQVYATNKNNLLLSLRDMTESGRVSEPAPSAQPKAPAPAEKQNGQNGVPATNGSHPVGS